MADPKPSTEPGDTFTEEEEAEKYLANVQQEGETKSKWEDVTSFLNEVASEMPSEHLIHTQEFTLLEAMSALEIMDPKMDSGLHASKVHTYEEAVHLNLLPKSSQLTIPNLIAVMDKLLNMEVMWFNGFSLTQTIFTCYYLFDLPSIDNRYLSAFVKALFKRSHHIRFMALRAENFEEEDFSSHLYGLDVHLELEDKAIEDEFKQLEKDLVNKKHKVDGTKPPQQVDLTTVLPLQDDPQKESEYITAVLSRVRFSKYFYQIWRDMDKPKCSALPQVQKIIKLALEQIKIIASTEGLGKLPDNVFELHISRRILAGSPPRKIDYLSPSQAFSQLETLLHHLSELCTVTDHKTLYSLSQMFSHISDKNTLSIVRSRLMSLVYQGEILGKYDLTELIKETGTSLYNIPKLYYSKHSLMKPFLLQMGKMYIRTFRVLSMNKARQRRKCTRLISEWSRMTAEADHFDFQISGASAETASAGPHYFGIWTMDITLRLMILYLQIGFELDLYNPHEYFMLFWYLDNLFSQRVQHHMYILEYNEKEKLSVGGGKKGKKKRPNKKVVNLKKPPKLTPFHLELLIDRTLCRGILMFLAVLLLSGKLKEPQFKFGSPELRFFRRFQPFHRISNPPPFNWAQYNQSVDFSKLKVDEVLDGALDSFAQCKSHIEKINNNTAKPPTPILSKLIADLLKVCVSNSLQLRMLKNNKKHLNPASKPNFDFTAHRYFPVISLV